MVIDRRNLHAIALLVFTSFSVRLDVFVVAVGVGVGYLVFPGLESVWTRLWKGFKAGIFGLACAAIVCVPIDSVFYGKVPFWAELSVIFYNVVENKSHLWGTSPWHWYVTNAIPRAIGLPLLIFMGPSKWTKEHMHLLASVVLIPVLLISFLPHKELRFIFPSILGLTVLIAIRSSTVSFRVRRLIFGVLIAGNVALSSLRLTASIFNYPTGYAVEALSRFIQNPVQHPLPPVIYPSTIVPIEFTQIPDVSKVDVVDPVCRVFISFHADINGYSNFGAENLQPCSVVRESTHDLPALKESMDAFTFSLQEYPCDSGSLVALAYSFTGFGKLTLKLKPDVAICYHP